MGSNTVVWIILIVLLGAMWYMSSRSRKTQQKAQEFRNNLKPGDEVMTHSGMLGTVVEVEGDNITLESAASSRSTWIRAAIAKLVEPPAAVGDVDDEADDDADDEAEGYDDDIEVPDDLSSLDDAQDDDEDGKDQK